MIFKSFTLNIFGEIKHSVGVAPFIIVPCNDLVEIFVQGDACMNVQDWGMSIMADIRGDNFILWIAQNSLHGSISSLIDSLADVIISALFLSFEGEVHDGNVDGGHSEGHSSNFPFQAGNNLA